MTSDLVRTWGSWHRENDADERKVWQRWLMMHGITPDVVRDSNAVIIRRPDRYQIVFGSYANARMRGDVLTYDTYVDEDGHHDVPLVSTIFQMEGPPLPFPDGVTHDRTDQPT